MDRHQHPGALLCQVAFFYRRPERPKLGCAGRHPNLCAVGRRPGKLGEILTTTRGFLNEAVVAGGGENLFAELTAPYPRINLEAVLARKPALVVELHGATLSAAEREQLRADWQELAQRTPDFPAPKVAIIDGPRVLIPGPGVTVTLQAIERELTRVLAAGAAQPRPSPVAGGG